MISMIESGKASPTYRTLEAISSALTSAGSKSLARDVMTKGVAKAKPYERLSTAVARMRKKGISQMPVVDSGKIVGALRESDIISNSGAALVKDAMGRKFAEVPPDAPIGLVRAILSQDDAVIVVRSGRILGIITKSDII